MRPLAVWIGILSALTSFYAAGARTDQPETALAGQVEVARLVDLAAHRLQLSIDYDAAALKNAGTITFRAGGDLSDSELWELANRVLAARGFTTVRAQNHNTYSVVKVSDAAGLAGAESEPVAGRHAGFRTLLVRARHRSAKDLADTIGKIVSKTGGSVTALGSGGLLVVSDLSTRVDQALALIAMIDVPAEQVHVEDLPVRNYSSQQIATLVAQVNAKRELVSGEKTAGEVIPSLDGGSVLIVCDPRSVPYWKDLITSLDKRDRLETATYSPRLFAAKEVSKLIEQAIKPGVAGGTGAEERWKLVTDELTGSLIITATPIQHEQIKALIERLDSAPSASRRPVRSFIIRNRPVRELQSILEQLVQSGVLASDVYAPVNGTGPRTTGVAPWPPPVGPSTPPLIPNSAGAQPTTTTSPAPAVVSLPRPVAETTFGAHQDRRTLPDLVLSADEGTNTLIAIGEPRLLSQIETLLQSLDVRQAQVMLEVLIVSLSDSQTLDLGVEIEALGATDDIRTRIASLFGLGARDGAGNRVGGDGLGLTGVILNPGDFSIILRALQTLNKGRSLSMPKLLVTNNQQATLDSVLEQPFVSTNASNTVTTTSFGGTKPAGTQITLKPQIAEGDHLLLDYNISLSAFVGAAASAGLPPPRQENKVQSAASLPDGHTVVVGGIELNTEGKGVNQVPGLAGIPILGELFKSRSNTNSRSRFYIFIRANILRHGSFEDLKYLSEVAVVGTGVDDGWPVVEPRVIR